MTGRDALLTVSFGPHVVEDLPFQFQARSGMALLGERTGVEVETAVGGKNIWNICGSCSRKVTCQSMEATSAPPFRLDLPFDLIQSIRLIHALLETEYDLRIPSRHVRKLKNLRRVFGVDVEEARDDDPTLPGLAIKHEGLPCVKVGSIERPLVFARGMVDHCRSMWERDRPLKACFAGRLHEERRDILREWAKTQYPGSEAIDMPSQKAVDRRVRLRKQVKEYARRIFRGPLRGLVKYVRLPPVERRTEWKDIIFVTSDRGWCHPTKAWDPAYFQLLSSSKFVLCPNGRFVWTYRFFEAAMCGAIPIVQSKCELYEGYRYYTMEEPLEALEWRRADALHNQELCRERLTIASERLDAEIGRLIDGAMQK